MGSSVVAHGSASTRKGVSEAGGSDSKGGTRQGLQAAVAAFLERHELRHDAASHVLDLVAEVGEIAKLVLETTDYGKRALDVNADFAGEIGDAAYSLLTLATALDVDVEQALRAALEKYESRIAETGRPGSDDE